MAGREEKKKRTETTQEVEIKKKVIIREGIVQYQILQVTAVQVLPVIATQAVPATKEERKEI